MLKNDILQLLKNNKNKYLSGQDLCDTFNVSRTAIWKCIKELKSDGYVIESQHKTGYMLISEPDILSYIEIYPYLKTKFIGRNYIHFESITSTNDYAKEIAFKCDNGTVIVSEEQTSGRGRLGRSWISNKGEGIWMSIILKPDLNPQGAVKLTQVAAVAVVDSIKDATGLSSGIKWPNDIIVDRKKVCGILTEMNAELDKVYYVVVGIGLNANVTTFPQDLNDKATSLLISAGKKIDRKQLTALILNNFEKYYGVYLSKGFSYIRTMCIKYSLTLNSDVRIISNNHEYIGHAIDIDDDGNLVVELKNGDRKTIMSGDVSVRGILGYV